MKVSRVAHHFWDTAYPKGDYRLSEKQRFQNAQAKAFVFGGVKAGVGRGQEIFHDGGIFFHDHLVAQAKLVHERFKWGEGTTGQDQEADAIAHNDDLRAVFQREESWLEQAERTVAEVREWREREAGQFWPGVARRWALALIFALVSAWAAGAGYAFVTKPWEAELTALRARATFAELVGVQTEFHAERLPDPSTLQWR